MHVSHVCLVKSGGTNFKVPTLLDMYYHTNMYVYMSKHLYTYVWGRGVVVVKGRHMYM